jgi:hypothetical protein
MTNPNKKLTGLEQANKAALANMSPRYHRLDELEKWVDGTQYKGRPDWFTGGPAEVPLWEREPCVVYPIVSVAISSNADLCLGEGKFPTFQVTHSGQGSAGTDGEEKTDPLEVCLRHIHRLSRFPTVVKDAYKDGQGCGTAVSILGVRNGIPFQDLVPAKWCTREVDASGQVTSLAIEYPYLDEVKQRDGTWQVRAMLYRRVIDAQSDTTYLPAIANENGIAPSWQADSSKTIEHGLGFCPVVWYPFMKGCQAVNVIDGKAIHAKLTDEIQAHDIARSQWHRGALYSEPQIYEIGVDGDHNPTGQGRVAMVPATEHGGPATPDNPIVSQYQEGPGQSARKKGPNHVWRYPSKDTKVGAIEYAAGALKSQQDNCSDLRVKIQEALAVVLLDPENIKMASMTSGKALEALRQKQLDRIDEHRDDLRDGFIVPSIIMQLRLLKKLGTQMKVPGVEEAVAALGPAQEFSAPDVQVTWGSYFKADPAEQLQLIQMVKEALKDLPLITKKLAVEKIAPIFGIKDIDALMHELEKEATEREAKLATELRLMRDEPGGAVSSNPAAASAGGNRRGPKDGQVDAVQDGD